MCFFKFCLCFGRRKCNLVDNSHDLPQIASEIHTESVTSRKQLEQLAETSKKRLAFLDKFMSICSRVRRRKIKSNPYSGRRLDIIASVSAEIAGRESLAAPIGVPVSVAKFTVGSKSKCVPVVLSSLDHFKNREEWSSLNSSASEIASSNKVHPTEIAMEEIYITSMRGAASEFSLPSISFTSSVTEHVATSGEESEATIPFPAREADRSRLSREKNVQKISKQTSFLIAVLGSLLISKVLAVGATLSLALVFGLFLRKHRGWKIRGDEILPALACKEDQKEQQAESELLVAAVHNSSISRTRKTSQETPSDETDESIAGPENHRSRQKSRGKSIGKNQSRCRYKFLHRRIGTRKEFISEPSSPLSLDGVPIFSSSTPSSPALIRSLCSSSTPTLPSRLAMQSKLSEKDKAVHDSPLQGMKRANDLGPTLTVLVFCMVMLGLLAGRCLAVLMLTFCWYAAYTMRHLAIPAMSEDAEKLAQSIKSSCVSWRGGKLDLQSMEYKKRVVMQGFLDRSRNSPT